MAWSGGTATAVTLRLTNLLEVGRLRFLGSACTVNYGEIRLDLEESRLASFGIRNPPPFHRRRHHY